MTNFTHNNHLKYRIGNSYFGFRESPEQKFSVELGSIDPVLYKQSSYRDELRRTADLVYQEFGKDLVLFLSGGTDSEIVLRNFLEIGVRPRCVVIDFKGGYNAPDVEEAMAIGNELDIDVQKLPFDVIDFYKSGEAEEFGLKVQCSQVTYLMVYYNVMKLGAPAVMGGEVLLTRHVAPNKSFWYYTFRENEDASAMRFCDATGIPLVNEWFTYTPELLLYYLEHPAMKSLVTEKFNYKLTSVSTKNAVLRELYPGIRQKIKTHGFERLRGFNHETYRALANTQIRRLESSIDGIEINQAIKMLKGEK